MTIKRLPIAFSSSIQRANFLACKWSNALTFLRFRKPSKPPALTDGSFTALATVAPASQEQPVAIDPGEAAQNRHAILAGERHSLSVARRRGHCRAHPLV